MLLLVGILTNKGERITGATSTTSGEYSPCLIVTDYKCQTVYCFRVFDMDKNNYPIYMYLNNYGYRIKDIQIEVENEK